MNVPTMAAPPTPWSKDLAEPEIDASAYVHSFSNLIGDVKVGANVLIAPGTSIRADEGTPFYIGEGSNIQDGVVIHGLEQGRVKGDDNREYSVWIGEDTCITHLALIHGPAYVGNKCFIGFRSTVFNARIGDGCIVMMHALIQDVEIPAGKYVPSGSIITNQQQADRLPDVQEEDQAFAAHVVHINEALAAGYHCAENQACINPIKEELHGNQKNINTNNYQSTGKMSINSEIVSQVRSLLTQGCNIGVEHADKRRFKTKSWLTASIKGSSEGQILSQLQSILFENQGQYVRLIGIDPQAKRRVAQVVIQRPDDIPGNPSSFQASAKTVAPYVNQSHAPVQSNNNGNGNLASEVRSLIRSGYSIGIEHANSRRFKTKSWLTAPIIKTKSEKEALSKIQGYLANFAGEYVRLIGVDTQAKRRVSETIIQHPGGSVAVNSASNGSATYSNSSSSSLSAETIAQISSLLAQGYQITTEHADKRHFKVKSWQSCSPITSTRENEVIAALEGCMRDHSGEYVRLIGIDTKARRRVVESIIQRPGQAIVSSSATAQTNVTTPSSYSSNNNYSRAASNGNTSIDAQTLNQIRSLLNQGYKIGTEHADKRRFKVKSWQSCSPITSNRETEIISALQGCIDEHKGEYVRLIGIDTQAKRRILETIIQRP